MNKRMRLLGRVAAMAVALLWCMPMKAALTAGGEYYIWLNIYEKLLGSNEAGDGPALSAYGTKTDGYVFVAESSGESGYFLLKQKSSGKYLAASGDNNWSVTLESKSTDTRFRWKMTGPDCYAYLTNKKNTSAFVGVDGANKGSTYVSIYYDKRKSSHGQFSVIPVTGSNWEEARQAYESAVYTNDQGVKEIDYCQLNNKTINRSDAIDIHITSNDNPILGTSSVNIGSDRTWLIFDNIVPSDVSKNYLKYVTINGVEAQKDVNCRVAIYLNGAAVIPIPSVVMNCEGTAGSFTLTVGNHSNLSSEGQNNTMTSFILRRGYMATLACETGGKGYSRVFVADHADQVVTLPNPLAKRVSSVNIKKREYLSKKGWGNTGGSTGGSGLRATWYWSWSAGYSSTSDMEYVPCRQHVYWPSASDVNNKTATAAISINEPDHSEQHGKKSNGDKICDCPLNDKGTITEWTTYGCNADLQAGGGRIGSPQPQNNANFSYLTQYFKYVDENNNHSRCDIAVSHAYLPIGSRNAASYAQYVTDTYWNLWNSVKRPIWLTELEVGATWNDAASVINTDDKARQYLQALLERLEESGYIERYAIYGYDHWRNYMYWDANVSKGLTPAGQVYRDHRSTFAYNANYIKVPVWWADGVKTPTLDYTVDLDEQTITFTVGNGNTDATDQLTIEYQPEGSSSWQTLITLSDDRNLLESNKMTKTVSLSGLGVEGGKFHVKATTLYGGSATSSEVTAPVISDLETLSALIAAVESYPLGFSRGEYAPYTNTAVLQALALVKEMKPYAEGFREACQTLTNAVWTPNAIVMDIIYDGTLAKAPIQATSENVVLPGWVTESGNMRQTFKGSSSKACLADAIDQVGLFVHPGTYTYGTTPGYTMPLEAGADYMVEAKYCAWADNSNNDFTLIIKKDGETVATKSYGKNGTACTTAGALKRVELNFTAETAGNYVLSVGANGNTFMTDFIMKKVVSTETVSVGPSGYATYVSGNDLDFTDTEIKAYMAAVEDGFVVLTPINKGRAGTPVVLYYKGGNKEEAIPFASSTDTATGNQLVAGEGKAVASDGGNGVVNCILNSVGGQIGFYRANGQMVAWNRAYLPVVANATRLDIRFANETTGVSATLVKSDGVKSEQLFDLKGQRISSPKKGVYIQNGKKVVK